MHTSGDTVLPEDTAVVIPNPLLAGRSITQQAHREMIDMVGDQATLVNKDNKYVCELPLGILPVMENAEKKKKDKTCYSEKKRSRSYAP